LARVIAIFAGVPLADPFPGDAEGFPCADGVFGLHQSMLVCLVGGLEHVFLLLFFKFRWWNTVTQYMEIIGT